MEGNSQFVEMVKAYVQDRYLGNTCDSDCSSRISEILLLQTVTAMLNNVLHQGMKGWCSEMNAAALKTANDVICS